MKRKLLSVLLTFCLAFSLLPTAALAATAENCPSGVSCTHQAAIGSTHYDTLQEAVNAATEGQTVTLLENVSVNSLITVAHDITIDLDQKTITGGTSAKVFATKPGTDVTIQNGTINADQNGSAVYAYGTLSLKNMKISGAAKQFSLLYVENGSDVTVDKDSVISASTVRSDYPAVFVGIQNASADKEQSLHIYGSIKAGGTPAIQGNGTDRSVTRIDIYDGATVESQTVACYLPQPCEVNIRGGVVKGYCALGIKSGTFNISGGTVQGVANDSNISDVHSTTNGINCDGSAILIDSYIGYAGQVQVNISDNAKVESLHSTAIREIGNTASKTNLVALNVTGGQVIGASGKDAILVRDVTKPTVTVSGGTFSSDVSAYCEKNYYTERNEDNTYTVKSMKDVAVAKIGDTYYKTLAKAVAAADNATVTLLKNTTEDITIPDGKTVTLDLGGNKLTTRQLTAIRNGSNLILKNGAIVAHLWVYGGENADKATKLTIGSDVVLSGGFPIVVEGGTNLGSGKGTYGFSKVEIAGTVKASSSGVWVMGNLGNCTGSMSKMTMDSNVIDILPTAKISGSSLGVTVMGLATVNIADGAEISGSEGIFVKRGTLNINGGTISGDRADFTLPPNANNNGSEDVGAALVISSTYNKFGTIGVNINGGTFTSSHGNAVYVGHTVDGNSINAFVNGYQLDITAGSFKGAAGKDALNIATSIVGDNEACKTTVTGGYFSSDPSAYVADGHYVDASNNGDYPYTVKVGTKPAGALIVVKDKTDAAVNEGIKTEDKKAIHDVIGDANIDGVAEAVTPAKKADIVMKSGVTLTGSEKVEIEIAVKVEAKDADLVNGKLTFEVTPEATVKVDGTEQSKKVPVTNDMLNGKPITVKLPLPTVNGSRFTPKQILHKFTGGGYEYFINESVGGMRGAGRFKIEDNCAVFTIYGFSTFELSGTVTYVAPSYSSGSSSDPTYSVSTPSKTEHGSVTVSPKSASKGDTVTVTVKPDSGYVLETLTVTDKNGNELTLKDKGNGKYTFTMPAGKVEVKATFMEDNSMLNFFYDVPNNAYFYEAVKWAVKNGITTGVGNDLFAPEQPCTRAQIVTFLWRAAGSPEPKGAASGMTDVVSGSYYEKAVAWAIENGITTGTTTSTFSPDATCTRAQAVTFLARALKAKAASAAEFSDVPTGSYFADAVAWAAANGVTEGIGGGLFGSDNDCTRGQIVTFLYRAYNK